MSNAIELQTSQQVYDYIRSNRDQLKEKNGNRLPTEEQLSGSLATDRFSVRRALRRLVEDGLIHSVRNRGYFFDLDAVLVPVRSRTSYHQFCSSTQVKPKSTILEMSIENPSSLVQAELGIGPGEQVWNLLFLRYRNDLPFTLTRSWLPKSRTPGLVQKLKLQNSLHAVLENDYRIQPRRQRTVCSAVNAGREEARHLDLPLSFALLKACSTNLDQKGIGIEYCETLYRGDITSLSFDLAGDLV